MTFRTPHLLPIVTMFVVAVLSTPGKAVGQSLTPVMTGCIQTASSHRVWLEKTLWGLYDQERGWLGAEIANQNGTHDLGPLQINSIWVPVIAGQLQRNPADVRRWLRDDTCFNVGVAAWLFLSGYRNGAGYWAAVGAYHSRTDWRASRYALEVAERLKRRFGTAIFAQAVPRNPKARSTVR